MDETTDKVQRSTLRMTGEWVKGHAPKPVADTTEVLISLIESNNKNGQMLTYIALGALVLAAVIVVLALGGNFKITTTGVEAAGQVTEKP